MTDRRKSYVGFVEHDEPSFKPRAFVNYFAGYLGWPISQPLRVDNAGSQEMAFANVLTSYGAGSVELMMTASGPANSPGIQRVSLGMMFDDPNDWFDGASEALVARTMRMLDEAVFKLTTYQGIWQRTTGYWRCGTPLYACPDSPYAER